MNTLNYFGFHHFQAHKANLGLLESAGFGLFSVNQRSIPALIMAGRALQRVWLTMTMCGIEVQPINSLFQFQWALEAGLRGPFTDQEAE